MFHVRVSVISLMCSICIIGVKTGQYCYADDENPYLDFGKLTSYEHVYNRDGIPAVEGCRPVQLWLLTRHGTRYPNSYDLQPLADLADIRDRILLNHEANKTQLCLKDVDNLGKWQFNVTPEEEGLLTTQGKRDLYMMARRLSSYFPELFNTSYSPEKFLIRHTNVTRTGQSALYFAKGLFGPSFNLSINDTTDNHFLHSYHYCPTWKNSNTSDESNRWNQGEEMTTVMTQVSRRLGFDQNLPLENLTRMYKMCSFDKAWDLNSVSPWCAAFSQDDLKVMEYGVDLHEYYKSGPGSTYGKRFACPIIKDMVDRFTKTQENSGTSNPLAVLYFSHDTLLSMVISRMGFETDSVPLKANNYQYQQNRRFRTSRFVHFATNVISVLYNCSGQLRMALYHAEHPMTAFGCQQTECDWTYLKTYFKPIVDDPACLDTSFCNSKASTCTSLIYFYMISTLFIILY